MSEARATACGCGCTAAGGARIHAIVAALRGDDLDRAMELGLLETANTCAGCGDACRALFEGARDARTRALAARARYRQRMLRLERREQERAARRAPAQPAQLAQPAQPAQPALPPAAAAALARAKARAAAGRT